MRKAMAVASEIRDGIILGADTIVMLDNEPLGKPCDVEDAMTMLSRLAGRSHEVFTGIAMVDAASREHLSETERTIVHMRRVDDRELRAYIATGEPWDKAGAYGIQGLGAGLVTGIEGDYFNVVGLPINRVIRCLHRIMRNPKATG
jgi:septum formation protein